VSYDAEDLKDSKELFKRSRKLAVQLSKLARESDYSEEEAYFACSMMFVTIGLINGKKMEEMQDVMFLHANALYGSAKRKENG